MQTSNLPPSVRIIVRDWLSANHVLLLEPGRNVLIDTGYISRVAETMRLLREPAHLHEAPLDLIVNTHCHSDHMGGNAALARAFGARVAIPVGEVPLIETWDTRRLLLDYADQRGERFNIDEQLQPGQAYQWGGLRWETIAAPGHDMGAVVFYCPEERLLISGDALWENGFGILLPDDADAVPAARATLEGLTKFDVRLVIPGHGLPFSDYHGALERAFARLDAFASDRLRMARSVLKALLTFTLIERGRLPLPTLASYLDNVPIYREYNTLYFGMTPQALADLLVSDLTRAGAIQASGGFLRPGGG